MAVTHADFAIESFDELERRFIDFLRAVPPDAMHLKVHSPVLASLLLDTSSLTESILKSAMDSTRYDSIHNIATHRLRRYASTAPYLNIGDLRQVFRPDQFYAKRVWYVPRGEPSFPWYAWRKPSGQPRWWTAYNSVKHARFDNGPKASLGTLMHAMEGTFLALVQTLDFRVRLVSRGIIRASGITTAKLGPIAAEWEPLNTNLVVLAVTRVFAYKYLSTGSPHQASDASIFL